MASPPKDILYTRLTNPYLTGQKTGKAIRKIVSIIKARMNNPPNIRLWLKLKAENQVGQKGKLGGASSGRGLESILTARIRLLMFDWKTSNAVYPDYICQLAAYWQLWNECRINQHLEPGAHLVRFGKDGSFAHHWIAPSKLDLGWEAFLAARKLHLRKPLENAA